MTNEQIIELAKQAGITFITKSGVASATEEWLIEFANLVRNQTLEEAAQKCTEIALKPSNVILGVAVTCAEQIRSMKK